VTGVRALNAQKHDLPRSVFGGFSVHGHAATVDKVAFVVRLSSGGVLDATFLRHEGLLGAMGALLQCRHDCVVVYMCACDRLAAVTRSCASGVQLRSQG
jgi:pantothenate kinase